MRIFAIKDDNMGDSILGYLIYYKNARAFYIELPGNADPWTTPLLLASFLKRGEHSVSSSWSQLWVEQRIIPPDRQNIGQILKENGLSEYDAFSLLMLNNGRCAQDDYYLKEIPVSQLPQELLSRWKTKVEDAVPLEDARLLIFFRNGKVKIVNAKKLAKTKPACLPYINNEARFKQLEVQPDGYGVRWNEQAVFSHFELYEQGKTLPLSLKDFYSFVQDRIVDTAQACKILNCSRQNIDDLIKRNRLHPIRSDAKHKLFLKNEIVQRKKDMD